MREPHNYAEWSACLDSLQAGGQDEELLAAMSKGSLAWNAGTAPLFSERINAAFTERLNKCADRMQRDFQTGRDEVTVVRTLLDARRTLAFLFRVAVIPAFPAQLSELLSGEVQRYAQRAQQSLEDSAQSDRSGTLLNLIRHNSLLQYAKADQHNSAARKFSDQPVIIENRGYGLWVFPVAVLFLIVLVGLFVYR